MGCGASVQQANKGDSLGAQTAAVDSKSLPDQQHNSSTPCQALPLASEPTAEPASVQAVPSGVRVPPTDDIDISPVPKTQSWSSQMGYLRALTTIVESQPWQLEEDASDEVGVFSDLAGTESSPVDGDIDDAALAWESVQEVTLTYCSKRGSVASADSESESPVVASATDNATILCDGASGGLVGPPLNREAAYGKLLNWLHLRGELQPARRHLFDLRQLLEIKDQALQIAELDALLATPFDDAEALHRQLAFSVFAKYSKASGSSIRPASCPRRGSHWLDMGFQGDDFATDLRGVGIVGLLHLLSFFGSYPSSAQKAIQTNIDREKKHGDNGAVPLACASLNFSSLAVIALREGLLSQVVRRAKSVHVAVLKVHEALMVSFVYEWCAKADATVLAFGDILQDLGKRVRWAPLRLIRELHELVPTTEQAASASYAMIRSVPETKVPKAGGGEDAEGPPLVSGELASIVKSASARRCQGDGKEELPAEKLSLQVSPLARACTMSSVQEMSSVFRMICVSSPKDAPIESLKATEDDLAFFLCDALGHGRKEVQRFLQRVDINHDGHVSFEEFTRGYKLLNSYRIYKRQQESFLRKPGSIAGQQFVVEDLTACELHVLDCVGACTIDGCSACEIVIGPSEASVFIRDCEDCTFYVATQQLRTRRCTRCTFFLYSATEPIIEMSQQLRIAPLALSYPGLATHITRSGFDWERNFWNAIFDFSSPENCRKNWKPVSVGECKQYSIVFEGADEITEADTKMFPAVTAERLAAAPLSSGQGLGARMDVA